MSDDKKCKCKHIKGIGCDAKNCIHHDGECYCTAEKVTIGPASATCSTDTACATFKQRVCD